MLSPSLPIDRPLANRPHGPSLRFNEARLDGRPRQRQRRKAFPSTPQGISVNPLKTAICASFCGLHTIDIGGFARQSRFCSLHWHWSQHCFLLPLQTTMYPL